MNFGPSEDQRAIAAAVRDVVAQDVPPSVDALRALGLFGVIAPVTAGGSGLGVVELSLCLEVLATRWPSLARGVQAHALGVLRPLLAVEGVTPRTRALAEGRALGTLRTGQLVPFAARAQWLMDLTGAHATLVAGPLPVEATPAVLGLREAEHGVLGPVGGKAMAPPARDALDVGIAAIALGIARGALTAACRYAQERHQFGGPIARFQASQWKIADSATELDAARLVTRAAAAAVDAERPGRARLAAQAAVLATEAAVRTTDRALQLHGGYGYVTDFIVERLYRDARALRFADGTPDARRDTIAAAALGHARG